MDTLRPAQKTGAKDYVGAPVENRLQEFRIVERIILEVRILHQNDVPGSFGKAAPHGRSLAAILLLKTNAQVAQCDRKAAVTGGRFRFTQRLSGRKVLQDLPRPILRAIVPTMISRLVVASRTRRRISSIVFFSL
jgi:hypothetical protein